MNVAYPNALREDFLGCGDHRVMRMCLSERSLDGKVGNRCCTRLRKSRPRKPTWKASKPIFACHCGALAAAECMGFSPRILGQAVGGLAESSTATNWRISDCAWSGPTAASEMARRQRGHDEVERRSGAWLPNRKTCRITMVGNLCAATPVFGFVVADDVYYQ